jgi:uncharacterized protein YkwD
MELPGVEPLDHRYDTNRIRCGDRGAGGEMGRALAIIAAIAVCAMAHTTAALARPTLLDAINQARAAGCAGKRGTAVPLKSSRKLDGVARRIAKGEQLSDALSKSGYRALRSSSLFMSNADDGERVARTLVQRACDELRSESVREIGIEKRGGNVWVVLAEPFAAPELQNPAAVSGQVLALANQARSRPRRCGGKQFEPAPPLTLEKRLSEAARAHARDMAKHNMLSHQGSNGSTPSARVTREGYAWRTVGENVASGPTTAKEVMEGWLASPGHCENLMSPKFTQMGLAYVVDAKSASGVYWAQVFATPK